MTDEVEMEFRDGVRWVPKYIAMKMSAIDEDDRVVLPYADALRLADKRELEEHVKRAQQRIIADHFRVNKYG